MVKAQQSRGQHRRAPPVSRPKTAKEDKLMRISGTTTMLGLIGTPVEHSKSPAMYNHCFQKFGLDWAYLAFDIPQEKVGGRRPGHPHPGDAGRQRHHALQKRRHPLPR